MVYSVSDEKIDAWFAAFNRQNCWNLLATKGANRDEIQRLQNTT